MSHREYFCGRCGARVDELPAPERKPQSNWAFLGSFAITALVLVALSAVPLWLGAALIGAGLLIEWRLKRSDRRFKCEQCRIDLPRDMVSRKRVGNAV